MSKPPKPSPNAELGQHKLLARADDIRERVEAEIGPIVQSGQQRVQVVERVTQLLSAEIFHGPIPHPKHIQAYEDACPGAADRIIHMAEVAQQRREDRKDKIIEHEFADRRLGLILGFSALICLVVAGAGVVLAGQTVVGSSLLGAAVLGTVVGTFVHGRLPTVNNKNGK